MYVVWGSTYLAIRITVEDLPAMSSACWRYATAASSSARSSPSERTSVLRVNRRELAGSAFLGLLLPASATVSSASASSKALPLGSPP